MLNRYSEIEICSRFVNCELWSCDMNSALGSVVPLAMFIFMIYIKMFVTIIMVLFRWILWCSSCPAFLWLSATHSLLQSFIVLQVWTFFPKHSDFSQVASASLFLERKYWNQIGPLKNKSNRFIDCHLSNCQPNAQLRERGRETKVHRLSPRRRWKHHRKGTTQHSSE